MVLTLGGDGTHRLQLTWNAASQSATFAIHQNYKGGPFKPTHTFDPINASANGFTTEHSGIYFGGAAGVKFDDFEIYNQADRE